MFQLSPLDVFAKRAANTQRTRLGNEKPGFGFHDLERAPRKFFQCWPRAAPQQKLSARVQFRLIFPCNPLQWKDPRHRSQHTHTYKSWPWHLTLLPDLRCPCQQWVAEQPRFVFCESPISEGAPGARGFLYTTEIIQKPLFFSDTKVLFPNNNKNQATF